MATVMFHNRYDMINQLVPPNASVLELGVQHGHFSQAILAACNPAKLVLVDAWKHLLGPYEADPANASPEVHEARYRETCAKFAGDKRVGIFRLTSAKAAPCFHNESFDLIYLDADHTEKAFSEDLVRWWPKVKHGGVLAGHDYTETPWIAVKKVVDAFVAEHGLELMLSGEPDWPSWAVRKP